ncbi:HAD-IC family P-type ATPase [Methylomonas koyamae]|uniref:HAD-IC family P-type ATPase n=1 Tax=Methylomonas koyamae TaxID=702114 RepID=UPI002872FCEC|nr:HAD-IC family P-type ATPase [Methylomonas koyamae]WNB75692.1 HAD-IC family P-type ATPase [Methylomonas koyamae]
MSHQPFSNLPQADWHAISADEALERLDSDRRHGLTSEAAQQRLKRFGRNRLPSRRVRPAWLRFLMQFHNALIYIMLAAAATTAFLGDLVDTGVLLAAVLVNAIIGFIQEGRAEQAMDAIRHMLSLRTSVIRNGVRIEIEAEALVPGDLVLLASGDKVPADLRLIACKGLRVNEAILTGESAAVEKTLAPVAADALLADRLCLLYSGTLVASGQATGLVVATGVNTELGRISTMLENVQAVTTPLLRQIAGFGHWLALVIVIMSAATFLIGVLWHGHSPQEMFMMAVALAASAIPEGLPAIMTITLALGMKRMARHNAIIRHLPAVETLGSVTVICSDKTGTLTRNEMTVQRLVTADRIFDIGGGGYSPEGGVFFNGEPASAEQYPELQQIARAAVLCNDAELRKNADGIWQIEGDPTEGALLAFAAKAGADLDWTRRNHPRADVIPFESEHRLMATLNRNHEGQAAIYAKGAPERILAMCGQQLGTDAAAVKVEYWQQAAGEAAALGLRLLAIAAKPAASGQYDLSFADLEGGFELLGVVGIIDPPRDEAISAVAACQRAGIKIKMITGDHADTARAIGAQLGIGRNLSALTGADIESMDDPQLREVVNDADIFARASPEHKLRLVQALQAGGEVVAMTGDGVNDAPALKRADVGVAMGLKGTEVAKEAADMVLADDNFATIANAVREGRGIYDNIRKFVLFMLPTNGGEALVVIAAILFQLTLPLTPAQVLWINMATSSTLGLALAFEHPERDAMRRPPRSPEESLLSWFFAWRVLMVSVLIMAGSLGLFLWEIERGSSLETARTMAVSSVVAAEMFYLVNSRYIYKSALSLEGLFGNRYVLVAIFACALLQLAYTHAGPLQTLFGSTDLSLEEWSKVLLAGAGVFAVAEFEKAVLRGAKRLKRHRAATRAESQQPPPQRPISVPRSLLAAVDFSDDAGNAAHQAALLAATHNGVLKLLHVVDETSLNAVAELIRSHDAAEAKLVADAQHRLDEVRIEIARETQVAAVSRVKIGRVFDEILAAAERADLLVLGARGANPIRDMLLGSTTDRLLQVYQGSVLVVKLPAQAAYRRVLVPVDFSPHSVAALKTAMLIAPDAEIWLIHAFTIPFAGELHIVDQLDAEMQRYCEEARQHAYSKIGNLMQQTASGQDCFVRLVEPGSPAAVILAKEAEFQADLIVMGKQGQSIVKEMLIGSVTRHVLADSKCDVLIVR